MNLADFIKTEISCNNGSFEITPVERKKVYCNGRLIQLYAENPMLKECISSRDLREILENAGIRIKPSKVQRAVSVDKKKAPAWKMSMEPWKSPEAMSEEVVNYQIFDTLIFSRS